jgi:5-methylcytosine-specific restriction protein A
MALDKWGVLMCEVCEFDFHAAYGDLGYGFMECHHIVPLCELEESSLVRLDDLALVCSNCHSMLHCARPWRSIAQLRACIDRPDTGDYHPKDKESEIRGGLG